MVNLEGEKLQNAMDMKLLDIEAKDKDLMTKQQSDELWSRIEEQQNRLNVMLQEKKLNVEKDIAEKQIVSNEKINKAKAAKQSKTKK